MIFNVITVYSELIKQYASTGVIARGCDAGAITVNVFDVRDYTLDKHGNVDDAPYGGGAGMVMTPQPLYDCIAFVKAGREIPVIYFSPKGKTLSSENVKEFSQLSEVILLCGHFEGIDQRVIDLCVDQLLSVGDFILTGGHIAAMCFIDSVARYVPGVLGNYESLTDESFEGDLLEHEQYTRPSEFMGLKVPEIILSGDHKKIENYKLERSLALTRQFRPDLIERRANKIGKNKKD